jgi:beta-glucosidase
VLEIIHGKSAFKLLKKMDAVIVCIGVLHGESYDLPFEIPAEQIKLAKECVKENPKTIVVLTAGSGMKMSDWQDKIPAIIHAWYAGEKGGLAIAEAIFGEINPSGKLPISIESKWEDSPAFGTYPPKVIKRYKSVDAGHGGKIYGSLYKEGILVGYRYYDTKETDPLYCFGYGLSYTKFTYKGLVILRKGKKIQAVFSIRNTGRISGSETAQLYVEDVKSSVLRPKKELKGFEKVFLRPGQEKEVTILLDERAFSFWHSGDKCWILEKGEFRIHIGASSRDIRLSGSIFI